MEDLFEDRNQRKDSAQRVLQTQGVIGAKAWEGNQLAMFKDQKEGHCRI